MAGDYEPGEYWSDRLADVGGLRSTGHVAYGESYNQWLYRRKRIVLGRALERVDSLEWTLDLGSGVGWVVEELLHHGAAHVHGVDISERAVEALRLRFPRSSFDVVRLGQEPLPVESRSVDCTTLLDVAYHIVDDERWEKTVADVGRVLRPGGSLVVIDAFATAESRPASHVRFRAADRWHRQAAAVGLDLVTVLPCYRWLSRPKESSRLRGVPETLRAMIEFGLDAVLPTPSHLSCAVYRARS